MWSEVWSARIGAAFMVGVVAVASAGVSGAQPWDRGRDRDGEPGFVDRPQIILFERPNFQGRSRSFGDDVSNLSEVGFNDHAESIRVRGRWRVCADSDMRGRCLDVTNDISDLGRLGLGHAISSLAYTGRRPAPPPPPAPVFIAPAPSPTGDSLRGATAALFLEPSANGSPIPSRQEAADGFCRSLGYAVAIYADYSRPMVRDLVCRR